MHRRSSSSAVQRAAARRPARATGRPVPVHPQRPSGPISAQGPGGSLLHALDRAVALGDPVVQERGDDRRRGRASTVGRARRAAPSARSEGQPLAALGEEQRLDAELVTGEHEPARWPRSSSAKANMPRKRRRHAGPQRRHASSRPRCRSWCGSGRPRRLELGAQLAVVVELAVVDEHQAVLHERLVGLRRTGR